MSDIGTRLHDATRSVAPEQPPFERLVRRRERRARNRRIAAAAVTLAVVGGVLGVTLSALGGLLAGGRAGVRPGDQDEARSDPRLGLGPGEYLYERSVLLVPDGPEGITGGTAEWEFWWALDGSGRVVSSSDTPSYRPDENGTWGPGQFPADEGVEALSTVPDELEDQLLERSSPGGASPQPDVTPGAGMSTEGGKLWRAGRSLLEMPNATPQLRAALFHVLSGISGVEVRRGEDLVGRATITLGIRVPHGDGTIELFFDPETLQPMGSRDAYSDGTWHHVIIEAGIVDGTHETPQASDRFFPRPVEPLPEP